jgi:hypothetical protein
MLRNSDIAGIMITLLIEEQQALFLLLADDGTVNRMGDGTERDLNGDMFIGRAPLDMFDRLCKLVSPDLLQWMGRQRSHPAPKGKMCRLQVGVRQSDGQELASVWAYGTESMGPPPEIREFVVAAIEITNPWFERQKGMMSASQDD